MLTDVGIQAELDTAIIAAIRETLNRLYLEENLITREQYLQYDLCNVTLTIPAVNPVIV